MSSTRVRIAAGIAALAVIAVLVGVLVLRGPGSQPAVPPAEPGKSAVVVGDDVVEVDNIAVCGKSCAGKDKDAVKAARGRYIVALWTHKEMEKRGLKVTDADLRRAKTFSEAQRKELTPTGSVEELAESMRLASDINNKAEKDAPDVSDKDIDRSVSTITARSGKPAEWVVDVVRAPKSKADTILRQARSSLGSLHSASIKTLYRAPKDVTVRSGEKSALADRLSKLGSDDIDVVVSVPDGDDHVIIAQLRDHLPAGPSADQVKKVREDARKQLESTHLQNAREDAHKEFFDSWRKRTKCQPGWPKEYCG